MKILFLMLGKTANASLIALENDYFNRIKHYANIEMKVIAELKNAKSLTENQIREKEGEAVLKQILPSDEVVLLDGRGRQFASPAFAVFIEKKILHGEKRTVFVVGGAYGFSEAVYGRANARLSLSAMTFTHQMVRTIFLEQLYRAFTIINGERYHHE